ncbi:hypothetical protein BFJ63_vAg15431 [Fusarium oxysporum f. sp. narcissi]|uniref:Uncharacterized protein n=1 Tax=Fusarium oxysporum f. sp. narcissi TaxID=451672 RepID=A0A4Q2V982_FUSOX|nr:hypothetical protein BFJ63_vAg15431 [Fusarium oxysporum f. sp. narcissi]
MFVFWSVHRDRFPEATTPLSRFGRYLLESVLLIIQLAFMIGVPAITSFLAWSTRNELWSALTDAGLVKQAKEVLGYLILDTVFLVLLIWGAVPVFAMGRVYDRRGRIAACATFGVIMGVLIGVSVRTMYLTWNWTLRFEDDARLAGQCNFITHTLGILLYLCWFSVVLSVFYVLRFGTPLFVQKILDDTAHVLFPTKMRTRTVDEKGGTDS